MEHDRIFARGAGRHAAAILCRTDMRWADPPEVQPSWRVDQQASAPRHSAQRGGKASNGHGDFPPASDADLIR
jgi:hypothetical protein